MIDGNDKTVFDAASLAIAEGSTAEVEIYDNQGSGTGIFVTVVSSESEELVLLKRRLLDRRLNRMQRRGGRAVLSSSEIDAEAMEVRVTCTKSWRGMYWGKDALASKTELPCTIENKRMVFTQSPLIRQQIDDAISDATLFTKG